MLLPWEGGSLNGLWEVTSTLFFGFYKTVANVQLGGEAQVGVQHTLRNLPGSAVHIHALRTSAALLWSHTTCQEVTLQIS